MKNLNPMALKEHLDSHPDTHLLDVREPWEFEICQIAGSNNISMSQVPTCLEQLNKEADIIVICHHGMRSLSVAQFLESQGFDKVINLEGGIHAWANDIDPDMPQY